MSSHTLRQRLPIEVLPSKDGASTPSSISDSESGSDGYPDEAHLPPFTPPTFTIKDLLGAIPTHCFERSAWKASIYVIRDVVMIAANMYLASKIDPNFGQNGAILQGTQGLVAKWALWTAYWTIVGFNFVGIWINAHECGHQAFSTNKTLNNALGLVLHSWVLMPYHAWRISHSKHHAATGHMTRDEVFVPATRSWATRKAPKGTGNKRVVESMTYDELLEDAPAYALFWLIVQQIFGFPAYLMTNASGQDFYPKWTNHYDPNSLIFDARHRNQILLSDFAIGVMFAGFYFVTKQWGFATLVKYYGIPYVLTNHWLVMITYLQHTDPNLPHYRAGEWTFPRGALCTVDRNMFGFVGPYLTHGICETHIAHHISSKIPHYHAWEATAALKEYLGEYYTYVDENMLFSLWKNWRMCRFVEDDDQVVFYKDALGRAQRRVEMPAVPSDSGIEVN